VPKSVKNFLLQGFETKLPRSRIDLRSGYFVRISSTVNAL